MVFQFFDFQLTRTKSLTPTLIPWDFHFFEVWLARGLNLLVLCYPQGLLNEERVYVQIRGDLFNFWAIEDVT